MPGLKSMERMGLVYLEGGCAHRPSRTETQWVGAGGTDRPCGETTPSRMAGLVLPRAKARHLVSAIGS